MGFFGRILNILLIASTAGVRITCNFEDDNWGFGRIIYTCKGSDITRENPAVITSITGQHLPGRTNSHVTGFLIHLNNFLTTVPDGVENFFPNLELIIWEAGILTSINARLFEPFPNLKIVGFNGNKLVSLDGDLFKHSRNLQEIYVNGISLEHTGIGLLTGLNDLIFVEFRGNLCVDILAIQPHEIQQLKFQLINQCPPLPAIDECSCKEEIGELKEEIQGIKLGVNVLKDENLGLQNEIGGVKEAIGELREEVSDLKVRNIEVQIDISEIKEGMSELNEVTVELKNKNVMLQEMIGKVQEDVGELKEGVGVLKDKNDDLQIEVGGLKEAVGELKDEMKILNEKLDRLIEGN